MGTYGTNTITSYYFRVRIYYNEHDIGSKLILLAILKRSTRHASLKLVFVIQHMCILIWNFQSSKLAKSLHFFPTMNIDSFSEKMQLFLRCWMYLILMIQPGHASRSKIYMYNVGGRFYDNIGAEIGTQIYKWCSGII